MVSLGPAVLLLAATSTVVSTLVVPTPPTPPTVSIAQGKLLGKWMTTREGRNCTAYLGIPYAGPTPRFKAPQPPTSWTGLRNATVDHPPCLQVSGGSVQGQEDCLIVNVYSPQNCYDHSCPVVCFIHGGSFREGSANSLFYGPEFLMDRKMVLVVLQYRLGAMGFLSLGNHHIPGNCGLKDQKAALIWIKNNIQHFGGDPDKVTILGHSAGAISAHLHMMFNNNDCLFRAGILHSGTAYCPGAVQRPVDQWPLIKHILEKTNCHEDGEINMYSCLQEFPAENLTLIAHGFTEYPESPAPKFYLVPVIEHSCVEDAFITDHPWNMKTSVPMICGVTKDEGLFSIVDNEIKRENFRNLSKLLGDALCNYPAASAVVNNSAPSYLYSYDHYGATSAMYAAGYNMEDGTTHVDDMFRFFTLYPYNILGMRQPNKTGEDTRVSKKLIEIWAHFIHHLHPVPADSNVTWISALEGCHQKGTCYNPPHETAIDKLCYLSIDGPDNFTMKPDFSGDSMGFWEGLPFMNKIIDPYMSETQMS